MSSRNRIRVRAAALAAAFGVVAACLVGPAHSAEVEGVEVADSVDLAGTRLQLNGAGMRTVYIVKAYVAALYVARPATQPQALYAQSGPRRLSITMLADLSSDWITERFVAAMRANHRDEELARLGPRIDRLVDTILTLGQTRKGERIDIDAIGGGTRVSVDGHTLGPSVPGEDLFDALLRIFIGEEPLDADLKRSLLGL